MSTVYRTKKVKTITNPQQIKPSLFALKNVAGAAIASIVYLIFSYFLIGFKTDQLLLITIFNGLYFASHTTRRFILGFSIFIIYWIIFDYMKAFPNYRFNEVNIESLYLWEKSWFGITQGNSVITPNEYFLQHTSIFLDIISGIFYLCWIPVPLIFAAVLFFKNKNLFFQFSLTFIVVNIIGWFGYYSYPAAPPWYVAQYGFDFIAATPGNIAGLGRFDALVGVPVFAGIYAKSSNVFAAMPSLHAAYIVIVFFFGLKNKMKTWSIVFAITVLGIWFAAVYTSHHYILDVIAGLICAILGISLFQLWMRTSTGKKIITTLTKVSS